RVGREQRNPVHRLDPDPGEPQRDAPHPGPQFAIRSGASLEDDRRATQVKAPPLSRVRKAEPVPAARGAQLGVQLLTVDGVHLSPNNRGPADSPPAYWGGAKSTRKPQPL